MLLESSDGRRSFNNSQEGRGKMQNRKQSRFLTAGGAMDARKLRLTEPAVAVLYISQVIGVKRAKILI